MEVKCSCEAAIINFPGEHAPGPSLLAEHLQCSPSDARKGPHFNKYDATLLQNAGYGP